MTKNKTPMTSKHAARIQSNADRTGSNQSFKRRAQSAASKHVQKASSSKRNSQ